MPRFTLGRLALAALLYAALGPAFGDDDAPSIATQCIARAGIRSTKAVDDQNVLFVMRDKTIYNSALLKQCTAMHRGSPLSFVYADSKLCAGTNFTVLMRSGPSSNPMPYTNPATNEHMVIQGPSLIAVATCQLGMFAPITKDEADELLALKDPGRRSRRHQSRNSITAEPVELPAPAPAAAGAAE